MAEVNLIVCDWEECGVAAKHNTSATHGWVRLEFFEDNDFEVKELLDFCSLGCLYKYLEKYEFGVTTLFDLGDQVELCEDLCSINPDTLLLVINDLSFKPFYSRMEGMKAVVKHLTSILYLIEKDS